MLRLFIVFFLFASVCYSSENTPTLEEAEKLCREAAFAEEERVHTNPKADDKNSVTRGIPQEAAESWSAMRIKQSETTFNAVKAGRVAYRECMSKYGYKR
jgi:hypothetical protein